MIIQKIKLFFYRLYHECILLSCLLIMCSLLGYDQGLATMLYEQSKPFDYLNLLLYLDSYLHENTHTLYLLLRPYHLNEINLQHVIESIKKDIKNHTPISAERLHEHFLTHHEHTPRQTKNWIAQTRDDQSTHHTSIVATSSQSSRQLLRRYELKDYPTFKREVEQHIVTLNPQDQNSLRHCLQLIESFHAHRHVITELSLTELLTLAWQATCDASPSAWLEPSHANEKKAHIESLLKQLIRMGNYTRLHFNGYTQDTLCFNGLYAGILEPLDQLHIDVKLEYTDNADMLLKRLKTLFTYHRLQLSPEASEKLKHYTAYPLSDWPQDLHYWLEETHTHITELMTHEFGNLVAKQTLMSYLNIECLVYLEPTPLDASTHSSIAQDIEQIKIRKNHAGMDTNEDTGLTSFSRIP